MRVCACVGHPTLQKGEPGGKLLMSLARIKERGAAYRRSCAQVPQAVFHCSVHFCCIVGL